MKICPSCTADNRDDATHCYYCGRELSAPTTPPASANRPGSTQPVRAQRPAANPGDTHPGPAYPPTHPTGPQGGGVPGNTDPGAAIPGAAIPGAPSQTDQPYTGQSQPYSPYTGPTYGGAQSTPAYPPQGADPYASTQGYAPPPPYSGQGDGTQVYYPQQGGGYAQGGYPGQPGGYPAQGAGGSGYYGQGGAPNAGYYGQAGGPPPPGYYGAQGAAGYPQQPERKSRAWPLLLFSLGLVFLCVTALAIWAVFAAINGGVNRLGETMSTQVAGVIPGGEDEQGGEQPTQPAIVEPTPWPTFTPEPVQPTEAPPPTQAPEIIPTTPPAEPTAAPEETQPGTTDRLLSPECSAALDHVKSMSDQLTSNPTAPFDAGWRTEFTQSVDDLKTFCGSLDSASPVPGHLAEARRNLDLAQNEFDLAKQLFNEGVEQLAPGKLVEAGQHVAQAVKHLDLAIEELGKING